MTSSTTLVNFRTDAAILTGDETKNKITASFVASAVNIAAFGLLAVILFFFSLTGPSQAAPSPPPCSLPLSAPPAVSGCVVAGEGLEAGQVGDPQGVAVNQSSGDAYVADSGADELDAERVDVFDREGGFERAFGWGVLNGNAEPQTCTATPGCNIANNSFGNHSSGIAGSGAGEFNQPQEVAVDNSPESSHGNVYVTDAYNFRVQEFDAEGKFELMFGREVNKTAVAAGPSRATEVNVCPAVGHPKDECGEGVRGTGPGEISNQGAPVAVDGMGHVWVGDVGRLLEFSSEGALLSELKLPDAGSLQTLVFDTSTSAFDLSAGDFYASDVRNDQVDRIAPPASGSYTLSFEGQTTAELSHEASAEEVKTALEALEVAGGHPLAGNVRTFTEPGVVGVEFTGALADTPVGPLTASAGSVKVGVPGGSGHLVKYKAPAGVESEEVATLDASGQTRAVGLDPENGDLFASDQEENTPGTATLLEYSSSGVELASFAHNDVIGEPTGDALAFDEPAQALFVSSARNSRQTAAVQAFVVPPPGPLVLEGSVVARDVRPTTATLRATVNPENVKTEYHFDYITEASYLKNVAEKGAGHGFEGAAGSSVESLTGEFAEDEVSAAVQGLAAGTAYRFCLAASNENGKHGTATCAGANPQDEGTFTTLAAALISEEGAHEVSASAASLGATIDPLGNLTEYRFEYLSEAAYQENLAAGREGFHGATLAPSPDGSVGSVEEGHSVSEAIQGLGPATTYRYRVQAYNRCNPLVSGETCDTAGPVLSFTTQASVASSEFVLPDGREWEMVTPPDKYGASIAPAAAIPMAMRAASDGKALTYVAIASTEPDVQGSGRYSQYLSRRTPTGWSTANIAVSSGGPTESAIPGEAYKFFSENLERALLQPPGSFSRFMSPLASEQTPYLREDFQDGNVDSPCEAECFTPLVSAANVPAGTVFGKQRNYKFEGPELVGASTDMSHAVLRSEVALTGTPLPSGCDPACRGLYEWSEGHLTLVSVAPQSKEQKEKGEESLAEYPKFGGKAGVFGDANYDGQGAISADGSRVVFEEPVSPGQEGLYLRDLPQQRTVRIDAPEAGCGAHCEGGGVGAFQVAIEAGEGHPQRVLFTDPRPLTRDAGAEHERPDLYQCEMVEGPEGIECRLSDLTPKTANRESGHVAGMMIGASKNGSWMYFVAGAVYTHTPDPQGESAVAGGHNLYALHEGETTPRLVAVLSGSDSNDWGDLGDDGLQPDPEHQTARVSPNGQWLAFMSDRPLTGYDNHDTHSGMPDEELFEYGTQSNSVSCVSCDPTGARPAGIETNPNTYTLAEEQFFWNAGTWLGAEVPIWDVDGSSHEHDIAPFQPRYLSSEGRVFFDTTDALVPSDVNGVGDVYEFEPAGVGDCSEATRYDSFEYVPAEHGCVGLISSGSSTQEAAFFEASENGEDVFLITRAKLSPADYDASLDVYDAHVCSSESPCIPSPASPSAECVTAEACRAAPAPEPGIYGAPPSATFNGQGNIVPETKVPPKKTVTTKKCKSGFVRRTVKPKRGKVKSQCVRSKHKKKSKRK